MRRATRHRHRGHRRHVSWPPVPSNQSGRAAPRTQLVLLGTGTPNADPERFGPAVAIVVDDVPYLVDFGPGVVRRAAAAFARGIKGLDPKLLRTAFVTHLHSDHTAGYPDLIFTPAVLARDAPLQVYGPPGIRTMTDHVMKAWAEDVDVRLPQSRTGKAGRLRGSRARGEAWTGLQGRSRHGTRVRGSPRRVEAVVPPTASIRRTGRLSSRATAGRPTRWWPRATVATSWSTRCTRRRGSPRDRPSGSATIACTTPRLPSLPRSRERRGPAFSSCITSSSGALLTRRSSLR